MSGDLLPLALCRVGTTVRLDGEDGVIVGTNSRTYVQVRLPSREAKGLADLFVSPRRLVYPLLGEPRGEEERC